jgi:hypothetical protein
MTQDKKSSHGGHRHGNSWNDKVLTTIAVPVSIRQDVKRFAVLLDRIRNRNPENT